VGMLVRADHYDAGNRKGDIVNVAS
jgi:hypothetical protein